MNRRLLIPGLLATAAVFCGGTPAFAGEAPADGTTGIVAVLVVYSAAIVAGSLVGGWLPSFVRLTHNRMQLLISFVGGLMLGIGIFHLLPHAVADVPADRAAAWMMGGIVAMFFLLRYLHFHQHEPPELIEPQARTVPFDRDQDPAEPGHAAVSSPAASAHAEQHHSHEHAQRHRFSWVGILLGLGIHTLIDGVALGASVQAESVHGAVLGLFGFGTFLAILLHKPLCALSITSLMAASGWSARARNVVNASFAVLCPLGTVLFLIGVERFLEHRHAIVGSALAFSGGVFVCIALSDLLPEMELHSHNRLQLSAAMLAGVLLAWALGALEPARHAHADSAGAQKKPPPGTGTGRICIDPDKPGGCLKLGLCEPVRCRIYTRPNREGSRLCDVCRVNILRPMPIRQRLRSPLRTALSMVSTRPSADKMGRFDTPPIHRKRNRWNQSTVWTGRDQSSRS